MPCPGPGSPPANRNPVLHAFRAELDAAAAEIGSLLERRRAG
ncbi:hypothetical protein ACIQWA_10300 [Kitasatospora sp. NPDC098652]